MIVKNYMKQNVIDIRRDESIARAVSLMRTYHIGTLPVIDEERKLVGIVTIREVLTLIMPDFIELLDRFTFVHDFGVLEGRVPGKEETDRPVSKIMRPPEFVHDTDGLLRAAATLHHSELKDIPVVDQHGTLVGIASHVDLGLGLMKNWNA